jgi:hypothetical protein
MVADAIGGAIRVPDASNQTRSRARTQQFWRRSQIRGRGKKMEYLIVVGVAVMMALYALIIARCLKEPEWQ